MGSKNLIAYKLNNNKKYLAPLSLRIAGKFLHVAE